jgi:broad specificity phosphatase PhoE
MIKRMNRLFYVRHGQTEMNASGHFSGQTETPLTKAGRQQAQQTGKDAKEKLPKLDLIICSPYERAVHTAEIIAKEVDYSPLKIEKNPQFIERTYGVLEGTPGKPWYDSHHRRELDEVEGAETVEQLQARAQKALEYLQTRKEENILVVGHGTFGRAFKRAVNKHPHTHEYEQFEMIDNAAILELI